MILCRDKKVFLALVAAFTVLTNHKASAMKKHKLSEVNITKTENNDSQKKQRYDEGSETNFKNENQITLNSDIINISQGATLFGDNMWIDKVQFSSDNKYIATRTGVEDKAIRIWDVESGKCIYTLKGHGDGIKSIAFNPNNNSVVATGSWDKTAKIWYSGKCIHTLEGHSDTLASIAFCPDGKSFVTGSWDKTARIWDAKSGECKHTLKEHSGDINFIAFSSDGKSIGTGSWDKTAKIWDAKSGECKHTLTGHSSSVVLVKFSPDGKSIFTGSLDETARIWDAQSGECKHTLEGHYQSLHAVAFSPDGKLVVTGSGDGMAKIWDVISGECKRTLENQYSPITSVAFSRDGNYVVTLACGVNAKIWDVTSGECKYTFKYCTGFSSNGNCFFTLVNENTAQIMIWNDTREDEENDIIDAVRSGSVENLESTLQRYEKGSQKLKEHINDTKSWNGQTPIFLAVYEQQDVEKTKLLLEYIDFGDAQKDKNPVVLAALEKLQDRDMAIELIKKGYSIDISDINGKTPIITWAMEKEDGILIDAIIKNDPQLSNNNDFLRLEDAAKRYGNELMVLYFSKALKEEDRNNLLIDYFLDNNSKMVSLLLQTGADANAVFDGKPLIWIAAYRNNPEEVELLLQHGAKKTINDIAIDETDIKCSPLDIASVNGYKNIVKLLVFSGAKYSEYSLTRFDKMDKNIRELLLCGNLIKFTPEIIKKYWTEEELEKVGHLLNIEKKN